MKQNTFRTILLFGILLCFSAVFVTNFLMNYKSKKELEMALRFGPIYNPQTVYPPTEEELSKSIFLQPHDEKPVILEQTTTNNLQFFRPFHGTREVVLDIQILKDGSIGDIKVVKSVLAGPGGYDEAAIETVKQWKFSPGKYKDEPIDMWLRVPVVFEKEQR